MFFSAPLMQLLFPQISFGMLLGNIKVGAFATSVGSVISTFREIEFAHNIKISLVALIGALLGATLISDLDQRLMLPAVILASLVTLFASRIANKITPKIFHVISFLIGIYAGVFGAGIGIMLIALIRLKHPADSKIAYTKIQARFVECMLHVSALIAHFIHGNIIASIAIPWTISSFAGGIAGGWLLTRIELLPGSVQKVFLCVGIGFALLVAALASFGYTK